MGLHEARIEPQLRMIDVRETETVRLADQLAHRHMSWSGFSGRRYVHTVHTLIACPPTALLTWPVRC